jgi:hypothetical protein
VAVNCCVDPVEIVGVPGVTVMVDSVAGGTMAVTVKAVLPFFPLSAAEMVVLPELKPVARPELLMVAILVVDEVHVAWLVMFWVLPSD